MIRRWNFAVVSVMCIGFAVAAVFDIAGLAQLGRQFGGYGSETGQFLAGGVAVLFVLLAGLNLRLWWGLRSADSRISANPQKANLVMWITIGLMVFFGLRYLTFALIWPTYQSLSTF